MLASNAAMTADARNSALSLEPAQQRGQDEPAYARRREDAGGQAARAREPRERAALFPLRERGGERHALQVGFTLEQLAAPRDRLRPLVAHGGSTPRDARSRRSCATR